MATVDDVREDEKARLASSRAWALILAPQLQKEDRHWCRAGQGWRVQGNTGGGLQSKRRCLERSGTLGQLFTEDDCVHNRIERPVPLCRTHVRYGALVQDTK